MRKLVLAAVAVVLLFSATASAETLETVNFPGGDKITVESIVQLNNQDPEAELFCSFTPAPEGVDCAGDVVGYRITSTSKDTAGYQLTHNSVSLYKDGSRYYSKTVYTLVKNCLGLGSSCYEWYSSAHSTDGTTWSYDQQ